MALLVTITALSALYILGAAESDIGTHQYEARLHHDLTNADDYDVNIRPFHNKTETVRVGFGLALINLIDVDEKKGSVTANYWLRYNWQDYRLQWDPSVYGDIRETRIPASEVWQPDLVLYNSVEGKNAMKDDDALMVVSNDGHVLYIPQARMSTTCSFDMTWFPYDTQICNIKVGSWTYDGFKLDIDFYDRLDEIDISDYIRHNEWGLLDHGAVKNVKYYPCCKEPYPDLTFSLSLRRKTTYYSQMYVMPGVVLAMVTPFIFALPVNRPHRYILGASLMITSAVVATSFGSTVPSTFATAILGRWFTGLQTIVAVALILSALISNVAEKSANGQHPPSFIKKVVVDGVGRLLCVEHGMWQMRIVDEEEGQENRAMNTDWFLVARVLDRIFFVVYCIIFFIMVILFSIR